MSKEIIQQNRAKRSLFYQEVRRGAVRESLFGWRQEEQAKVRSKVRIEECDSGVQHRKIHLRVEENPIGVRLSPDRQILREL